MNANHHPVPAGATCQRCGHPQDDHVLVLVRETPASMGLTLCPDPGCPCGSTWRAADHPSNPTEVEQTRRLVRQTLRADGYPIPGWLM